MITIFFIVDGPLLEAQAALLAGTLRHHNGDRFRLLAYVAERHWPALNPDLATFFAGLGVGLRQLAAAPALWAGPYPHGNKILAAAQDRGGRGHGLFLDSDMICTAPLDLEGLVRPDAVALCPEGRLTWGKDLSDWARVYGLFDLPLPDDRVILRRGKRRLFLPYFNAGMILFPEGDIAGQQSFGAAWRDTALVIDHGLSVGRKRPWLDQISLPVTLKRHGINYLVAPEALNFSAAEREEAPGDLPALLHYHRFSYLAQWPRHRREAVAQTLAQVDGSLADRLFRAYGTTWISQPESAVAMPALV